MQTIVSYLLADVAEEIFLPTPWREMDLPTWDSEVFLRIIQDLSYGC